MHFFKFLSVLGVLSFLSFPALAQGHSAFCERVDSTAASQGCLKRHLDSAQKRLNKVYKSLSVHLKGDKLQELQDLQAIWLVYRDAECMWEVERSETTSLKKINELSCMARVTEDRVNLLTIAYADGDQERATHEYGAFPRWMNVLSKDQSGTYWNYGNRSHFDLDCDGEEEYVMQGVVTSLSKVEKTPYSLYKKDVVVAIAQNPPIGRPVVEIFKFNVGGEDKNMSVCSDNISIEFDQKTPIEKKNSEESDSESPKKCLSFLKVKNKGCAPKIISWTGKKFVLEVEDTLKKIEKKK